MTLRTTRFTLAAAGTLLVAAVALPTGTASAAPTDTSGTVFANQQLTQDKQIQGASSAYRYTFWSKDSDKADHLSSGTVFLPDGNAPAGGFPVISWSKGADGIADKCAPSLSGPQGDAPLLSHWLQAGYAVVSTDYAGVGTGAPKFVDGRTAARTVVDGLRAAHDISPSLSSKYVMVGQSQGATVAMNLAAHHDDWAAGGLDYRGTVATGVPAHFDQLLLNIVPGLPLALPAGMTANALFLLAAVRAGHPDLKVDAALTDSGKAWLDRATTECGDQLQREVAGLPLGTLVSDPLSTVQGLPTLLSQYVAVPSGGFDKPVLVGQGLTDTTVVLPFTLGYLNVIRMNRQVTVNTFAGGHDSTPGDLQSAATAFVNRVMR
ncbi:alpha/beta hydrolase [Williamsia sterculiae]|uniref:Secretory lipase n=1 Tax=Williamsia sterculiae TaxID=1344003 RepID=A0A1N7FS90_9NOCA|nr:lipase family protein [Williamsia sterculiae]SIS03203.1 Secretory lipase [Williamsia sterculiae]